MKVDTRNMDTRTAACYAVLAAYVVFLILMFYRSQRQDRQLSAIDRRTKHLRDAVASGGFDA
jgi:uncharacterized membrane protein YvbJ